MRAANLECAVAVNEPFLRIVGVEKVFESRTRGALKALDTISLDIQAGEFVSIVGPSGCGKSTLMMMVSGLMPATCGEIVIDAKKVTRPYENLGIVFQRDALLEWRNVLDNVLLQVDIRRLNRAELTSRAIDLLGRAGLAGFEKYYPWELSGGMRQRVAICLRLEFDESLGHAVKPERFECVKVGCVSIGGHLLNESRLGRGCCHGRSLARPRAFRAVCDRGCSLGSK
jgi:NitT/TauT family transport system ATP-binding protein